VDGVKKLQVVVVVGEIEDRLAMGIDEGFSGGWSWDGTGMEVEFVCGSSKQLVRVAVTFYKHYLSSRGRN